MGKWWKFHEGGHHHNGVIQLADFLKKLSENAVSASRIPGKIRGCDRSRIVSKAMGMALAFSSLGAFLLMIEESQL